MKLSEITAAMQTYANQRNTAGAATMQAWYNNRNMFPYTRDNNNQPIPPATDAYVHAYPGIIGDTLVFFVISAYKDVPGNTNIENDIEVCATNWLDPVSTSRNPSDEFNWVQYWITNYSTWIGNNIPTIFQGFRIPQADTAFGNTHNALLALKTNSGAVGVVPDLVVQDTDGQTIEYHDTVTPVPPFDPSIPGMVETDYYLYTLLA
jgi:hypothetical protein